MIIHTFFCIFFGTYYGSPNINYMNDAATDSDFPLERGMCLDGSHDFGNDIDRSLSPDLVRRVEQEDR